MGADDAILVHDLNGDGDINNITEMLSEYYGAAYGTVITSEDGNVSTYDASDIAGETVDVAAKGVTRAIENIGNDTLVSDALFSKGDN